MNKAQETLESLNTVMVEKEPLDVDGFIKQVEAAHKKVFPKAWISVKRAKILGDIISIQFGVQNPKKHSNNITLNDPAFHSMLIDNLRQGEFKEKISLEINQGGFLFVKPEEGSFMAFSKVKFGWRNKKGTPEQIVKHLANYFGKMKKVVDANKNNLVHEL